MSSKQVLRSVVRSTLVSRVSGWSSVTSFSRIFCAEPSFYAKQSAFFNSPNCTLSHCVCRALRGDATIAENVVNAVSDVRCEKRTYTTHVDKGFRIIPACHPFNIRHQNDILEWRRNLTTHAMEDYKNQPDDPVCVLQTSNSQSLDSQAIAETMQSGIILQEVSLLEANNVANMTTEKVSGEDSSEESVDVEKEFYNLIEAEDSPDELLSMLLNLEQVFSASDPRVCHTCLRLAKVCNDTNKKPEKVIDYARQAFHNFDSSRFPLESARALFLVGVGHYKLGDLNQAISSLETCVFQMARLELPSSAKKQELALLQHSVQIVLGQAKISLGWNYEGLVEFKKGLTVMEKVSSAESPHLGFCYQKTASVFLQAKEPKEALSLCKKALLVFVKCFGPSSSEVADLRSLMLQIYYELNEYKSVLCECQQAVKILEKLGETDKAINLDLESIQAYFVLEKFNEAVAKLNEIVKRTHEEDPLHVEALILLVRAFSGLKDNTAAAENSRIALNVLEKKELNFDSAKTLVRLSMGYQQLQNYDQALAISQRALDFFERCPGEEAAAYAADARGYIGSLFLSIGKTSEAISHLERALTMKKSVYGSESWELLDVFNHLGVAYAHAEMVDEALAVFREAKMILNTSNNGADLMSIYIYNNISLTCSLSGRIEEAIESKKHAIQLMRKVGKETSVLLNEGEKELEILIKGTESGEVTSKSDKKMLKQMLTSCMPSCTQDNAIK